MPFHIESVTFASGFWIFDTNHCHAAIRWIANQRLTPAAIDSAEMKIGWICGHRLIALESAPSRGGTAQRMEPRHCPTNLDVCHYIDFYFDRALRSTRPIRDDSLPAFLLRGSVVNTRRRQSAENERSFHTTLLVIEKTKQPRDKFSASGN